MGIARRVGLVLIALLLLGGAAAELLVWVKQPHTPAIRDSNGEVVSGSIASLEQVEVGGRPQWILVRGRDTSNPVLLFLHGGPGIPSMYLAHAFQRPLEDDFVVVQWDRRGAGETFRESLQPEELSVKQLLQHTRDLVDRLRRRFDDEKIYLVGHSFGSYLGMLFADRYPERLHAFVGVGQVVDRDSARVLQRQFIQRRARETGRPEALNEIERRGVAAHETWLF